PPPLETTVPNAILIDARTGNIFYEKNADQLIAPASTSKLMTAILIFDALKAGKLTMDQEFLISEDAWRRGGAPAGCSTMYAKVNSRVKLSDLIQGIIVQSANDGCIAVAEGMAGSEPAFADRMTRRARELGLTKSVFRNSTGLPDPEHVMTVRELSMLAQYIIKAYPEYYHYYSQPAFTWNKISQKNRNPLLVDYPGAEGMKTGYTKEAGYNLVGSALRDGRRLVLVVAGALTIEERRREAQKILDWGFKQFRPIEIYNANDKVGHARVWGGESRWVDLVTPKDVRLMLSTFEQQKVTVDLRYTGPLQAPVKAGTKAGSIEFNLDGRTLAEFPLETSTEIAAVNSMWLKAWDSMIYMVFGG
ncbi:MAG TPA: D-alanyl-D-alanine carboxypeptidase family protein, partial [Nordella sp.]|nr:D-alanyl-D-alanine carboxypeptidase family protein [Nordella sp.]